jgi:putative transposase
MHLNNPTKKGLAESSSLSRSMLYYRPRMPERDWALKIQIEETLHGHPSYGYRRVAQALAVNPKRTQRVMHLFGIKAFRRRGRRPAKARDSSKDAAPYQNLLLAIPFPASRGIAWVSDFTYLRFHDRFVYLATVMDLWSREVVGWSVLNAHTAQLTVTALIDALGRHGAPYCIHSDQGNEYRAKTYTGFAKQCGINVSMSRKASPWENGYQESFYSQFKVDLGDPNRFRGLAELTVALHHQILYYNNQRIHSRLKMPPSVYAQRQLTLQTN